jgi:WD40 repeat protein
MQKDIVEGSGLPKTSVFLSYSRRNLAAAEQLRDELIAASFDAYLDKHDILPGEPWQDRLGALIAKADTVVFLLSPDSIASKVCDWEVNEAERLSKRVLPVVLHDVEDGEVPGRLQRLNYIFMRSIDAREVALERLRSALLTDIGWVREHTRIGELAARWQPGRDDVLLRGSDLGAAERWFENRPAGAPEVTERQRAYIEAGRKLRTRQQIVRTRWRNGLTLSALGTSVVVGSLAWFFYREWLSSQQRQSLFLADQARQAIDAGDVGTGMLLAIEALPDAGADGLAQRLRPRLAEPELVLDRAWRSPRELAVLAAHQAEVETAIPSPDGRWIFTSDTDGMSLLWDATSASVVKKLEGLGGSSVLAAEFSGDSRLLAAAAGGRPAWMVWDLATGRRLGSDTEAVGASSVHFSPDGRHLLIASRDGHGRIVRADTGELLVRLEGHRAPLVGAVYSPSGHHIATASEDFEIRVWDSGARLQSILTGHTDAINDIGFSQDDGRLLSASQDGTIRVWNRKTGTLAGDPIKHEDAVLRASFSPDGGRILSLSGASTLTLLSATDGSSIGRITGHTQRVHHAEFSPDGLMIATASRDQTARLWDGLTGQARARFAGHTSTVWSVRFSHDGRRVVTGSWDGTARIWSIDAGRPDHAFEGHGGDVFRTAVSGDGNRLATASDDGTARVWDIASGAVVSTMVGHERSVLSVSFSPDGGRLATSSGDATVRLWDISSGRELGKLVGHQDDVFQVSFSPDGRSLLTASADATARLWASDTHHQVGQLLGHSAGVRSAQFSNDGGKVVTASTDKTARIWDAATGKLLFTLSGHDGHVLFASFSPDARHIATASAAGTLRLWDAASGQERLMVAAHTGELREIWSAMFSPDNQRVVTASSDRSARIWDASTGAMLALIPHARTVWHATFGPRGDFIVTGCQDRHARLWRAGGSAQELVDRTKSQVPRCLSLEQRRLYFLEPSIPRWCNALRKWPFGASEPAVRETGN